MEDEPLPASAHTRNMQTSTCPTAKHIGSGLSLFISYCSTAGTGLNCWPARLVHMNLDALVGVQVQVSLVYNCTKLVSCMIGVYIWTVLGVHG